MEDDNDHKEQEGFTKTEITAVSIDLETSGLDLNTSHIIQVGCDECRYDGSGRPISGQTRSRFSSFVRFREVLDPVVTKLTGIKSTDLFDAPTFLEVISYLERWLRSLKAVKIILVTYNGRKFDLPMLFGNLYKFCEITAEDFLLRNNIYAHCDILQVLDARNICVHPRTLSNVYLFYTHRELKNAHSALADCCAVTTLCLALSVDWLVESVQVPQILFEYLKISNRKERDIYSLTPDQIAYRETSINVPCGVHQMEQKPLKSPVLF